MNEPPEGSLAERRLDEHLELLRTTPPAPGTSLVPRVMRRARWQTYLRGPLRVVGMIGSAFGQGLAALLRGGRSR